MTNLDQMDPYRGNILTQGLGPILSREEALQRLMFIPPVLGTIGDIPRHVRMHHLLRLQDLHLPTLEGGRLMETLDLIVRPSYRYRDPNSPSTWGLISGETVLHKTPRAPASAALVEGHSGVGKTQAILRGFECYPQQVIVHPAFPRIVSEHVQMVWLSADVPATGRAPDLATNLMRSWDSAMTLHLPGAPPRFADVLDRSRRDGSRMLDEWRQVAVSHFLGVLHLDEVQNFFRLQSLEARRKRKSAVTELELSIIEDQCLKWLLTVTNTWQIGLVLSGTPDGVGALTKRLANVQRFATAGYHPFPHFKTAKDPFFADILFPQLMKFQFVKHPITAADALAELVIELSGGILRLIIALWIAAHRVAFERQTDDLQLDDFRRAAETYLAPIGPAVAALRSGDPALMSRYEDLIPRNEAFWASFLESIRQ